VLMNRAADDPEGQARVAARLRKRKARSLPHKEVRPDRAAQTTRRDLQLTAIGAGNDQLGQCQSESVR
jgi:hypothetical protein